MTNYGYSPPPNSFFYLQNTLTQPPAQSYRSSSITNILLGGLAVSPYSYRSLLTFNDKDAFKFDYDALTKDIAEHFRKLTAPAKNIYVMGRPVELKETETFTVSFDIKPTSIIHDEMMYEVIREPAAPKKVEFVVFDRPKEARIERPELILCRCDSLVLFRHGCRCGGH